MNQSSKVLQSKFNFIVMIYTTIFFTIDIDHIL